MEQAQQVFKWLIVLALLTFVAVGAYVWQNGASQVEVIIITPTPRVRATWTATGMPTTSATPQPTRPPVTWTLSPTPTETQTPSPTPSATPPPSITPSITPTPGPIALIAATPWLTTSTVVSSSYSQPTPMARITQPKNTVNILLLGTDRQPGEKVARTDVMMIASIFPDVPSISLTSIPRDYYAWIPTWGLDKINTAYLRATRTHYPGGGPALVRATVEYNFGVPIHYYALVDFSSYRSIVDAVGGVDIIVECPFHDTYPDEDAEAGMTEIDMEPGLHHLDGKHALWYVRSRWNTSDFDRHRRQQQVLWAMLNQALNQNLLLRVPELWSVYQEAVETDMTLQELLYLAPLGLRLDTRDIKSRFVRGSTLLEPWTAPNGGYVLVPHYEALATFMEEAAQPPLASRATQRAYRVAVVNGTGRSGWGTTAAYRLGLEGFIVTRIEAGPVTYVTTITDFTTTSKGSPLYKLLRLYKRQYRDVLGMPTEDSDVDFHITLGTDYDPCAGTTTARWRSTPTPSPTPTATP